MTDLAIDIDYDKLADAIAVKLINKPPFEDVLWTAEECADYLKVSVRNFKERISKHHKFPLSIRPEGLAGRMSHRWYAKDVIEWAKRSSK